MASSSFDKYCIDPKVIFFLAVLLGDELESSLQFLFETCNERLVL